MKYLPFFEIQLMHTYYTDQRCLDFSIEPKKATEDLLKNHRCISRALPNGIMILMPVENSGTPFLPFPETAVFAFNLRLQNLDFPLFTDLSGLSGLNAPLYTNEKLADSKASELSLESRSEWMSETLLCTQPGKLENFVLGGRPIQGIKPEDFKVTGAGDVQSYEADTGLIVLDTRTLSSGRIFSVEYPVLPKLKPGVFSEVEIHNNNTLTGDGETVSTPRRFQISFSAKAARWTYYCVTDLTPSQGGFRIVDARPTESGRLVFSDQNRQDLDQTPDPGDDIAKNLVTQYPQYRKFRFLSDTPVLCSQAANPHLEFYVGENKLSGSLPNPSFRNNYILSEAEGRSSKEDALFHVIKYVNP